MLQDMVIEYVAALLERAVDMASFRGKLKYEDFVWQVCEVIRHFMPSLHMKQFSRSLLS